jgi:hypothetical protein
MHPLDTINGKFYVGETEIVAEPVYIGLEADVKWEGALPPLERVIASVVCDLYENKGIDLFEANAYRMYVKSLRDIPGQTVADGNVPPQGMRKINLDFYKVRPKNPPGKKGNAENSV